MSRMRLRIAQRLKEAQNTCAMLTTFNEVDMRPVHRLGSGFICICLSGSNKSFFFFSFFFSNIQEMKRLHKDAFLKKHNIKLGFMSAFVKAAAHALTDQPVVNAGQTAPPHLCRALNAASHLILLLPRCFYLQSSTMPPRTSSTEITWTSVLPWQLQRFDFNRI